MADAARCPYCHTGWEVDEAVTCDGCATVSHRDCWVENQGCAVLGCSRSPEAQAAAHHAAPAAMGGPPHPGGWAPVAQPAVQPAVRSVPPPPPGAPPARPAPPSTPAAPAAPASPAPEAPSAAPPGWHPDPYGSPGLRWWDGTVWTEHLRTP